MPTYGTTMPGRGARQRKRYPGHGGQDPRRRHRNAPITDQTRPPPGGGGGADGGAQDFYSLDTDPILAAIRAQNQQMIANSEASAQAQREKLLLQYGDPELARQFGGETQARAAEQNPFSILKQLQYGYQQNVGQANESLNKANLFYSSTRGQTLGELGRALSQGQASAGQSLQDALSGITSGLLDVRQQAGTRETDALNQAYQNALAFSQQYGIGPKDSTIGSGGRRQRRRRRFGPRPGNNNRFPT